MEGDYPRCLSKMILLIDLANMITRKKSMYMNRRGAIIETRAVTIATGGTRTMSFIKFRR